MLNWMRPYGKNMILEWWDDLNVQRICFMTLVPCLMVSTILGATKEQKEINTQEYLQTAKYEHIAVKHLLLEERKEQESEQTEEAKEQKKVEKATAYSDVELLAKIIYLEAGGCTYRHKQLVGCVVINRMNHEAFPNTLEGVIYQKNQYYPKGSKYLANATPDSECYEIATDLLTNGNNGICPNNVLFQAEFVQGEVYEVFVSSYGSTTYFCYGGG